MLTDRRLEKALDALPAAAHKELLDYVGYLEHKFKGEPSAQVVKLGGMWANLDFDVTDEEVRALRREVTRQLVDGT